MRVFASRIGSIDWFYLYEERGSLIYEGNAKSVHEYVKKNGYTLISMD